MENKRGLHLEKTFLVFIFFFFFLFFFLNSVSAICIFGIGNTCAFIPADITELSSNLLVSYRFDQPFDLGADYRVWNSAGLQNGLVYFGDIDDFLINGLDGGLAFKNNKTHLSTNIDGFDINEPFSFSTMFNGAEGNLTISLNTNGAFMTFNNVSGSGGYMTFGITGSTGTALGELNKRKLVLDIEDANFNQLQIRSKNQFLMNTTDEFNWQKGFGNDTWHQAGFSYDGSGTASGVKLYFDGKQEAFDILANDGLTDLIGEPGEIFIGSDKSISDCNFCTNTTMDNVLVYDKVLSSTGFKTLYNDGLGYTKRPSRIANFKQDYNIGGSNITIKGYNLKLNNYYVDYLFSDLHFFDPAFGNFRSLQALKPLQTSDCSSGDIYVCLNSTDQYSDYGKFDTSLLFTSPIGDQINNDYFESFYLTLANPFGYSLASFNVNITPVTLSPVITDYFKYSYNLDLYPSYTDNCTIDCQPNLVLKMNDYFSNAADGDLRFYTYINISYGSLNISIPKNNTYYSFCDESQNIILCYYNYESSNLNDIWLVFYENGFKQAYKVNVIAGNSYGFVNQSFGITSGGADYIGLDFSVSDSSSISLTSLALRFNGLFPESSTLSVPMRYAYVLLSIVLLIGLSLFFLKSQGGIVLGTILSILTFIYYIFIDYVSITLVVILVSFSFIILAFKLVGIGGGK